MASEEQTAPQTRHSAEHDVPDVNTMPAAQ